MIGSGLLSGSGFLFLWKTFGLGKNVGPETPRQQLRTTDPEFPIACLQQALYVFGNAGRNWRLIGGTTGEHRGRILECQDTCG